MVDADAVRELHQKIRAALDDRESGVAEREAEANKALAECAAERQQIGQDRATLQAAEQVYFRLAHVPTVIASPGLDELSGVDAGKPENVGDPQMPEDGVPHLGRSLTPAVQRRARIGPQRYLILAALREHDGLPSDLVERATGLAPKRVREQLAADEVVGVIARAERLDRSEYTLTAAGLDLLVRFESYRVSRGLPLPTRESAQSDGDEDEYGEEGSATDATASTLDESGKPTSSLGF